MTTLWIVHRDPLLRSALFRAAGAPADAVCGAPGDPAFAAAPPADVVVLGTRGRSGLAGTVVGNTAEKVFNTTECSILAVKPADFVCPVSPD